MAYDEALVERLRDHLAEQPDLSEKKMFGGLAFLLDGRMAVAAVGHGGLMVRVVRDQTDHLIATTRAAPMVMRGKELQGWVVVAGDDVRTSRQLGRWVSVGVAAARVAV